MARDEVAGRAHPDSRGGGARLREVFAHVRRLWREFTGESAYERYVERHRREHPDHEPMTERQFWRLRADFDEANVSTGCC
ncbi:MAG: YbdD/YjiX family protein [Actinomycetaceae bacterium]|nr:YbdD/YjiX family protein [Actinomycetaceae bacterium]